MVTKKLSLITATTIVAASMIGVGVFTTSGFALAALGTPGRVLVAWGVGSFIAMCGAISYAALAAKFTESGGEYLFLARAIHPAAGLTAGVVSMLAGFTGPIAAAAIGLEAYASPMLGSPLLGSRMPALPVGCIAVTAILIAAVLHAVKVSAATRMQDAIVGFKLILILGFIGWGFFALSDASTNREIAAETIPFSIPNFASQLVWISFSFAGFNAAIYVAGEVRDPARNVPRALIGGTALVSVIYLLLNTIFVYSAPIEVITAGENISQVAATAAVSIGGTTLENLVRVLIVTALATSISAMVMTGPRVYAKMADDGLMPSFFSSGNRSPVVAIGFQAAMAIVVVLISRLQDLLSYLGLTLSLCSALAIASLFVLRFRGQISRLPGWGIPPAVFIFASVSLGIIAAWNQPIPAIAAVATLTIGGILFWLQRSSGEAERLG
ncbi:APC family permease [Rubripirellula obstinata]|nr:amino acid permease [Rubripirellula obstinata]